MILACLIKYMQGSFRKSWDWDCVYPSHWKHLRLLIPSKKIVAFIPDS